MEDAWEVARRRGEEASKGGRFLRLKNHGDSAVVAFCGDPYLRNVIWTGEKHELFDARKHGAEKPTVRVALNVYVPVDRAMKIFEGSLAWFMELVDVRKEHPNGEHLFEIKRHGRPRDTKTTFSTTQSTAITPALKAEIAAASLHDLLKVIDNVDETSATVTDDVARSIAERLKGQDRAVIDAFLAEFKIARVRDLRASQVSAVDAWLAKAQDPFA